MDLEASLEGLWPWAEIAWSWAMLVSASLLCIYPIVLLTWTIVEGKCARKTQCFASKAACAEAAQGMKLGAKPVAGCLREAVLIVMVGLPARGKSYIARSLVRHLQLLGYSARTFNAGQLRRVNGNAGASADFFSATNEEAKAAREQIAMQCTNAALDWITIASRTQASVAILDATNTTAARRCDILKRCSQATGRFTVPRVGSPQLRIIFLESMCSQADILQVNYEQKMSNDDYKASTDFEKALEDFRTRVQNYEEQYEPVEEEELRVVEHAEPAMKAGRIRVIDGGERVEFSGLVGSHVAFNVCSLLQSMHLAPRRIFLAIESAVDPHKVRALVRALERADPGHPVDILCGTSALAEPLQTALPPACDSTVLTLNSLSPRPSPYRCQRRRGCDDEAWQMRDTLLLMERLRGNLLAMCPSESVRHAIFAHFYDSPEKVCATCDAPRSDMILELSRNRGDFSARLVSLSSIVEHGVGKAHQS